VIGIVYQSIEPEGGPTGRGGWLIVVAGGLIYTVLGVPVALVREWLPMLLSSETWAILGDPKAHDYHPSLPAFLLFQLSIAVLVGFAALVGLILFAQRSEHFPKYMITYYLGSFALLLAVLIVEEEMWAFDPTGHYQTAGEAAKAFLWAVGAVPYLARSRRVKNTFVKRRVETAEPGHPGTSESR
jgi:uncharacterized protein DUF2569